MAFRGEIDDRVLDATDRLVRSYARIQGQLVLEIDSLLADIAARRVAGKSIAKAQVRKLERYQRLIEETGRQLTLYGGVVEDEVLTGQLDMAELAVRQAPELLAVRLAEVPERVRNSILATFGRMPAEAVTAMVGALQEGSPLLPVLARFGPEHAMRFQELLLTGLASGKNPRTVARELRNGLGVPLTDALRITRTEMLRAHRMATHASYRANSHVVSGWTWFAALDDKTCMACVAMHGTKHGNDETLDDHPNGRCVAIPDTVSFADLGFQGIDEVVPELESGEDWFARQPESVQRDMMGPSKFEAWQDGAVSLSDLAVRREDPDWGGMVTEASLKELGVAA